MTPEQKDTLAEMLCDYWNRTAHLGKHPEFHHGLCVGADDEAAEIASEIGFWVIAHPGDLPQYRGKSEYDEIRQEKPCIERNHDIVDEVEEMFATPGQDYEIKRGSGTWATIRYTEKNDTQLTIIYPNGEPA